MRVKFFVCGLVLSMTALVCGQTGLTTVGFTGDSITANSINAFGSQDHTRPNWVNQTKGDSSWSHMAVMMSGGNLTYFRNWAQHGARAGAITDNIINVALKQTELPDVLVVHMGSNDVASASNTAFEQVTTAYQRLFEACKQKEVEIIPCSIIPNSNSTPSVVEARLRINAWIRGFSRKNGLRFIDLYPSMAGSNGLINPALSGDGVHPNAYGHMEMGKAAARCLRSYAGVGQPFLTQSGRSGDPLNLLYNGAFEPFMTRPSGWTGHAFESLNSPDIPGVWARFTSEEHTGAKWLLTSESFAVKGGHTLEAGVRFRTQGFSQGFGLYFLVKFNNAAGATLQENWVLFAGRFEDNLDDPTGYVCRRRMVVPSGATKARFYVLSSNIPNSYQVDLAQLTLYDLTDTGLAPSYFSSSTGGR